MTIRFKTQIDYLASGLTSLAHCLSSLFFLLIERLIFFHLKVFGKYFR